MLLGGCFVVGRELSISRKNGREDAKVLLVDIICEYNESGSASQGVQYDVEYDYRCFMTHIQV